MVRGSSRVITSASYTTLRPSGKILSICSTTRRAQEDNFTGRKWSVLSKEAHKNFQVERLAGLVSAK